MAELCIFQLYYLQFTSSFEGEKTVFSSCEKIRHTAVEATVKCSPLCSRSDERKFWFKLCAGSARFYAAVRGRSAFLCSPMSSLTCTLSGFFIFRFAGASESWKIEVVYVLLACSSALGLYPVCASNRRHHQSEVGGPSTVEGSWRARPF